MRLQNLIGHRQMLNTVDHSSCLTVTTRSCAGCDLTQPNPYFVCFYNKDGRCFCTYNDIVELFSKHRQDATYYS
jgi:hypothetical protein